MLPNELAQFHHLTPNDQALQAILQHPELSGLTADDLKGKSPEQAADMVLGEYFAKVSEHAGKMASSLIMRSQWGYGPCDWFDHRHHMLDPATQFNDFWTMSPDNVTEVMPFGGTLLDLCAGDAFYDYHFYRHRAKKIVCVDINPEPYKVYRRLYQADNIEYKMGDVLAFEPEPGSFDVVVIRGAIEHFSEENQQKIFRKALKALKVGGWFCGDTPANADQDHKMLEAHEHEWQDEAQMRKELVQVFDHVESKTLVSKERTTLFWRCKKTRP